MLAQDQPKPHGMTTVFKDYVQVNSEQLCDNLDIALRWPKNPVIALTCTWVILCLPRFKIVTQDPLCNCHPLLSHRVVIRNKSLAEMFARHFSYHSFCQQKIIMSYFYIRNLQTNAYFSKQDTFQVSYFKALQLKSQILIHINGFLSWIQKNV